MAVTDFGTANQTYRVLMGNGLIYTVPRFQRDYTWADVDWDDLWHDMEGLFMPGGEPAHYMGYLVLQTRDSKNFDIIDGQQRLTTLSIIVLAVLKNLQKLIDRNVDADNNRLRQTQLRSSFIGYLDPVSLVPRSKLTLNRNNDRLFQQFLVPLETPPKRGLKATEHLMRKAFDWFEKRIGGAYRTGEELARFIDQLSDKLFFTVITVSDELNAYKVFETLNARGVKLSSTDLLKNYLFQVVSATQSNDYELDTLDNRWEVLVSRLGSESFPDFLRVHWNSRNKFLRHAELYKSIRDTIRDRGGVFELLRAMEADVEVYVALSRPEDELWTDEQRRYVQELKLFNVRQIYSFLLSAYRRFSPDEFTTLLRICSVLSFRYNVIGNLPPNEQERTYAQLAEGLTRGRYESLTALVQELRPLYPSDQLFERLFSEKVLKTTQSRNRDIMRYILFKLEAQQSATDYDFQSDRYNVEHILPQNPGEGWEAVSDQEHEQFVYRLGNMAVMEAAPNRAIGNASYTDKRIAYLQSEFDTTRQLAEHHQDWGIRQIASRQQHMARVATAIWRVGQLS
jgi:hypothetical protein